MRRYCLSLFLLLPALLFLSPPASDAVAQGYTWTETSSFEIPALGRLGRMLTNKPIESVVYQSPTARYSEQDDQAQVIDLDRGVYLMINHKEKEYTEMTFEEMFSWMEANMEEMQAERERVEQEAAEAEAAEDGAQVEYTFEFDADATGETRKIDGHEARQLLMTLKVLYTAEATDEEGRTETASGNFFVLLDSWRSDDLTDVEEEFMQAYAERMGEAMGEAMSSGNRGSMEALGQAFQQDPRIGPALERLQEEQAKAPGVELQSTAYFVIAPEDQEELDVDAILNPPQKKRRGLGRLARAAAGLPGADSGNDDQAEGPQEQSVVFTMTTERKDFDAWTVEPNRFEPPAGYTEVEMPTGQ